MDKGRREPPVGNDHFSCSKEQQNYVKRIITPNKSVLPSHTRTYNGQDMTENVNVAITVAKRPLPVHSTTHSRKRVQRERTQSFCKVTSLTCISNVNG